MTTDVHTSHCCDKHGCKYGYPDCSVELGTAKQQYPCETCGLTQEGFYTFGGYYDHDMVWQGGEDEEIEFFRKVLLPHVQDKMQEVYEGPCCTAIDDALEKVLEEYETRFAKKKR